MSEPPIEDRVKMMEAKCVMNTTKLVDIHEAVVGDPVRGKPGMVVVQNQMAELVARHDKALYGENGERNAGLIRQFDKVKLKQALLIAALSALGILLVGVVVREVAHAITTH